MHNNMLFNCFNNYRNDVAITDSESHILYSELLNLSSVIYSNIGHRCLVFCLCQNTIGSLCGYISFISKKVVPLMLDSSINKELLDTLITNYKPEFLWMPSEQVDTLYRSREIY